MNDSEILEGTTIHKNTSFKYEIFMNPGNQPHAVKQYIINRFGDKLYKGKICLDITKDLVEEALKTSDYKAILFVKNIHDDDEASASLQVQDWKNEGKTQLWIHDLCRINNSKIKSKVSPVEVLFNLSMNLTKLEGFQSINLMILEDSSANTLINIYKKYGFYVDKKISLEGVYVMKKELYQKGGKRKTRKRKNFALFKEYEIN